MSALLLLLQLSFDDDGGGGRGIWLNDIEDILSSPAPYLWLPGREGSRPVPLNSACQVGIWCMMAEWRMNE